MVKEKQQFLENEMDNNQEEQKKIKATDRLVAKLRLDYQDNETQRISFTDEVRDRLICQPFGHSLLTLYNLAAILSRWALFLCTPSCQHSAIIFADRNLVRPPLNYMR